jgi:4-amino-4-deoxy-L-arabinose transferase-like glycosyltransferase
VSRGFFARTWPIAVTAGILLRLGAVLATPVFPLVEGTWDTTYYDDAARSLASGEGYRFQEKPTAFFPPGFPAALSIAYRVGGTDPRSGQVMNFLASLALLAAAAGLAGATLGAEAARRTAFLMALDPTQIVMPAFLMSETLCAALLAAALALAARAWNGRGRGWILAAALLAAMAGMTRGHALLILPAVLLVLAIVGAAPRRRLLAFLVVTLLVQGAVVAAWAVRNQRELGSPVIVSANGSLNFLLGNNPNARGGRTEPPGGIVQTGDEVEDARIYRDQAMTYVRENPGRFFLIMPVKLARLLGPAPVLTYRHELLAKWGTVPALIVLAAAQLAHLAAWVLGILALRHAWAGSWRVMFVVGATALAVWILGYAVFWGGARFFFPVQFLLWIGAAEGLIGRDRLLSTAFSSAPTSSR